MTRPGAKLGTALLLLLAGCQAQVPPAAPAADSAPQSAQPAPSAVASSEGAVPGKTVCRSDIETSQVSERGIGGTGGPMQMAERGIGGTGITGGIGGTGITGGIGGTGVTGGIGGTGITGGIGGTGIDGSVDVTRMRGLTLSDRGLGGTGIAGTITGFASVCLNGLEVGINNTAQITVDGTPIRAATLRLGEVAVIDAASGRDGLRAVSLAISHEVSGPVDSVQTAGSVTMLQVAGQRVVLNADARSPSGLKAGDWVAVSGLRDLDRVIHASRIDRREPGQLLLTGRPVQDGGEWKVGSLRLQFSVPPPPQGERVVMSGGYEGGIFHVASVSADRSLPDPGRDHRMILEGYAAASGNMLRLSPGLQAAIGPDFGPAPAANELAVVEFTGGTAADLVAVSWRPARGNHAATLPASQLVLPVPVPVSTTAPAAPVPDGTVTAVSVDNPAPAPAAGSGGGSLGSPATGSGSSPGTGTAATGTTRSGASEYGAAEDKGGGGKATSSVTSGHAAQAGSGTATSRGDGPANGNRAGGAAAGD